MFCPHGHSDRLRQNREPSSPLTAFPRILKLNSEKQKRRPLPGVVRRTFHILYGNPVQCSVSERFSSYPEVELAIAEMACVSRNIRTAVPAAYGIPVQRSISERDGSYP